MRLTPPYSSVFIVTNRVNPSISTFQTLLHTGSTCNRFTVETPKHQRPPSPLPKRTSTSIIAGLDRRRASYLWARNVSQGYLAVCLAVTVPLCHCAAKATRWLIVSTRACTHTHKRSRSFARLVFRLTVAFNMASHLSRVVSQSQQPLRRTPKFSLLPIKSTPNLPAIPSRNMLWFNPRLFWAVPLFPSMVLSCRSPPNLPFAAS